MARLYINHFSTKLTAQLLAAGTTVNVTPGDGALVAAANGTDWFIATLRRISGYKDVARDIVKITNRSTDALTIVRAQEGTTALQFEVGDQLDIDFTAASFADAFNFPIVAAGGTVNAITATYAPAITLTDQKLVAFRSLGENTSAIPTFAPNGLTAHQIVSRGGLTLLPGDIGSLGFIGLLQYDAAGTVWELLNPTQVRASPILRPSASHTPPANGDLVFEKTSNTELTVKLKGSDGVVRSIILPLE